MLSRCLKGFAKLEFHACQYAEPAQFDGSRRCIVPIAIITFWDRRSRPHRILNVRLLREKFHGRDAYTWPRFEKESFIMRLDCCL